MKSISKRLLSLALIAVLLLSAVLIPDSIPQLQTVVSGLADIGSGGSGRQIDFDYQDKYKTPEDAMKAGIGVKPATQSDIEKWKEIGSERDYDNWTANLNGAIDKYNDYITSIGRVVNEIHDWMTEDNIAARTIQRNYGYILNLYSYNLTFENYNPLRNKLESTDPDDKFIRLTNDYYYLHALYQPEPIMITEDKVLDLNGHSIILNDQSNMNFRSHTQNVDNPEVHQSYMFNIGTKADGSPATLTIIDSSGDDSGLIKNDAYMVDPYDARFRNYTTRDIFYLTGGNLVIYGGTFEAGRSKGQQKSSRTWESFKKICGKAVALGASIAEYANGINVAQATLQDLKESFTSGNAPAGADEVSGAVNPMNAAKNVAESSGDSTAKKDGIAGAIEEVKVNNPQERSARNQTVNEKLKDKNKEASDSQKPTEAANKANDKNTGKKENEEGKKVDGKNVQLVNAEKKVADAALDGGKIGNMLDGAFDLVEAIGSFFKNKNPITFQSIFGTVVKVANNSTFVSYGGKYIGYGSSANTRNAVVEVYEYPESENPIFKKNAELDDKFAGGLAYIYGGDFEAYSGANVFNIVKKQELEPRIYQAYKDGTGKTVPEKVTISQSELNGVEPVTLDSKGDPVSTKNIAVRGGIFNCHYEALMMGLDDDEGKKTVFPGTCGVVNLGIESFSESFIKDGRIQICDPYNEGELVLMDDYRDENEQLHHYRLYCSDLELRYRYHLKVYPGAPGTNTTHSFKMVSTYGSDANNTIAALSFSDDALGSERSSAYGDEEKYFEYPVNPDGLTSQSTSAHYFIKPSTEGSKDVYGTNWDTTNLWYYPVPVDAKGNRVDTFNATNVYLATSYYDSSMTAYVNYDAYYATNLYLEQQIAQGNTPNFYIDKSKTKELNYKYLNNLKWFRYKVYRVDPLTRENISESSVYGEDVPLADIVYGTSDGSLKCNLPLYELEQYMKEKWADDPSRFSGFKPGEMYRVVLSIDEYVSYDIPIRNSIDTIDTSYRSELSDAAMTSSILFVCYDEQNEKKEVEGRDTDLPDYTPLQWITDPEPGKTAQVQIMNGKAGQSDVEGRKIFDVYYQWFEVDENGNEKLIAGTTDVYRGTSSAEQKLHTFALTRSKANVPGGYSYLNTLTPEQQSSGSYDSFGMPKDKNAWTCDDIHAYTFQYMGDTILKDRLFGNDTPGLDTNYPHIFETGTDSCYIPLSAGGKDVFCRATVVNIYWPLNYDHVQVFETHRIHMGEVECKVYVEDELGFAEYTVKPGDTFTLPQGIANMTNNNKEFDRWNLGEPGDRITITGDTKIKALWKTKVADLTAKVTLTPGEGSGTPITETVSGAGSIYRFPECVFTAPNNSAFQNWYVTDSTGEFIGYYSPGDCIKVNKALVCEAQYNYRFYIYRTQFLNENTDESNSYYVKICDVGKTFTLPSIPSDWSTYEDKIATGWNLGKPGDTVTLTSAIVNQYGEKGGRFVYIYPVYRAANEYVITYDANGGRFDENFGGGTTYEVTMDEIDAAKYFLHLITDVGLFRQGYEFVGWSAGSPGELYKVTGDATITAQWKEIPAPAQNWHSEYDYDTETLTVKGSGIISREDGAYMTGVNTGDHEIKHVIFSEGITEINKPFIAYGSNFETISLPSTLEKIGAHAFSGQGSGLGNVTELDVPASVKCIGAAGFAYNGSLRKVTLHEGLEDIGKDAFSGCFNLSEITIPSTVKRIGRYAFGAEGSRYFCNEQEVFGGLEGSKVDNYIEGFTIKTTKGSLAEEYAIKYGFNYDNGDAKPAPVTNSSIHYTVDESAGTITVTGTGPIPDYNYFNAPWTQAKADRNCHKLIIGEGITSIGKYAFAGMLLTEVQFPSTLKKIDDYAFIGCDTLGCNTGITFPDSLESIGVAAFRYVGAKTIHFGSGLKTIGAYAFCDRYFVYNVDTSGSYWTVTNVSYVYDVEIPANVEEIGDYAFGYYNTYVMDWRYDPFTIEAPLSNLGGKDENGKVKTLTIVTPKGSQAEKYAKANGFKVSRKGTVSYVLLGDVNYDGVVSSADIRAYQWHFEMYVGLDVEDYRLKEETADIDGDGVITTDDRDLLQQCLDDNTIYKTYIKPIRVVQ